MADSRKQRNEPEKGRAQAKSERRPSKAETEASQSFYLKLKIIERFFDVLSAAVYFLGCIGLLYMGMVRPLQLTAGKQTIVDFAYRAALDLKLHMIVPWAAAAMFGVLWQRERNLRKKTVAREHGRMAELEQNYDPGRTSSGLTTLGEDPKGTL